MTSMWIEKKTSSDVAILTKRDLREMKADGKKMLLPLGYDATTSLEKLDKGSGFSQFTADDCVISEHNLHLLKLRKLPLQ